MSKLKLAHPSQLCVHNVWPIPWKGILGGLRLACKERYRRETRKQKEETMSVSLVTATGGSVSSLVREPGNYIAAMFVNWRRVLMLRETSFDK